MRQNLADLGTKHAENVKQLKSYQSYLEQKHAETVANLQAQIDQNGLEGTEKEDSQGDMIRSLTEQLNKHLES